MIQLKSRHREIDLEAGSGQYSDPAFPLLAVPTLFD